ncbi:polynucleotide 5'-hydroxyl-kinase NOL9-like [Oppia nitens]|uniref:polynucleotide 5'-hydroxyl-kinase NOL9-like n=1 Tax=Oppia nitens TaxID=1686743 RepID=UPI0023D9E06A|nr:polynucleotide 5'-hydroxyl-kinase NOL9-like [Oppia nitens]
MKTKREIKCIEIIVIFCKHLFNGLLVPITDHTVSMPRVRPKLKTTAAINGHKYSSLWFALKATQNYRHLRYKPSINYCRNYHTMNGFTDENMDTNTQRMKQLKVNELNDDILSGKSVTNEAPENSFKVIDVNDKSVLLVVTDEDKVLELNYGSVRLTLLSHNYDLHINGYSISVDKCVDLSAIFDHTIVIRYRLNENQRQPIDSIRDKLQTLGVTDVETIINQLEENSCFILLEKITMNSLLYLETLPNFKPTNLKLIKDWFNMRSIAANNYNSHLVWDRLFDELKLKNNDMIVVTGGTNVGKSSLIRHMINRYLFERNVDDYSECLYLDTDPGQSEFSTAGQLSLSKIKEPMLSSTVLNVINDKPLMSCSVAATTPSKAARLYMSSISQLIHFFRKDLQSKGPLFINTMGWTRDLGLALLTDIIKIALPTHLIQINSTIEPKNNFQFDLTSDAIKRFNGYRFDSFDRNRHLKYKLSIIESNNRRVKKNQMTRDLQQLSYMAKMPDILYKPIYAMNPYKLLWSKVYVKIQLDSRFAPKLSLDVLNCSWIHLCRLDPKFIDKYYVEMGIKFIDSIDRNECFGSAIIRGIDFQNKCFYILSPESREILESVNCIVRPSGISIPDKIMLEQLNYSSTSKLPYIFNKS